MNAVKNPAVPNPHGIDLRVCADAEAAAGAAAELFVSNCAEAIADRGRFRVALSGGSTPRRMYELLASPTCATRVEWSKVDVFWSDERYVGADDPSSNYRMTREALLSRVPILDANVYRIPTELSPATAAAAAYERSIRHCFDVSSGVPRFDLIFLGLGTNGHTASLFPHSAVLHETSHVVAADFVSEVNMWRITMTVPLLNAGRTVAFLVTGEEKADVVREIISGARDPERLPAQLITPQQGALVWILDPAAAGELDEHERSG